MKQIFPCLSVGLFAISPFFISSWHHAVILLDFGGEAEPPKALVVRLTQKSYVGRKDVKWHFFWVIVMWY